MSRTGKIARLPRTIRDQLNRRLEAGEAGEPLLAWLNALPETQTLLAERFASVPVSKQNLSEWRLGGFAEWQTRQDFIAGTRELAADAGEVDQVSSGRVSDHLATVLAARYATALAAWNGEPSDEFRQKLKVLRGLCRDVAILRRGDHSAAHLRLVEDQVAAEREKTEAEIVAEFEAWSKIPAVHDWLCQTWVTPKERARQKRELFGLPPLPEDQTTEDPDKPAPKEPAESNLVKPNQTNPELTAQTAAPVSDPPQTRGESNLVKPNQTKTEATPPAPPSADHQPPENAFPESPGDLLTPDS